MKYWDKMSTPEKVNVVRDFLYQFKCDLVPAECCRLIVLIDEFYIGHLDIDSKDVPF